MPKISVRAAARDALRAEKAVLKGAHKPLSELRGATADSFQNFAFKLGVGADGPLSAVSYGFNPVTRNRQQLEWIYRGSWLGGVVVDCVADDMTRKGVEFGSEMPPDQLEQIETAATRFDIWAKINEVIRWGRLYGGAVGVLLIDGHDMRQPLNSQAIAPGSFRGILPLDRWMLEPSLSDLVTEMGPHMGLPAYYKVQANAPALRGLAIHHSRILFRIVGIPLPYQQALTEQLWGISVLERMWDRMIAFDSASTGAAQLVYKSYLRTLKVKDLRQIVATGGDPMNGLVSQVDLMRRYQGNEGITLIDGEDEFDVQQNSALSGMGDLLDRFGEQVAGAAQVPLTRLLGQSPGGLNSTGDSEERTYYDGIAQKQQRELYAGVTLAYKVIALSEGLQLPPNFALEFKSLWQMSEADKASYAKTTMETIGAAKDAGLISDQVALQELRQASRISGVFTNITQELIDAADAQVSDPLMEQQLAGLMGGGLGGPPQPGGAPPTGLPKGDEDGKTGPNGQAGPVDKQPRVRIPLQQPAA